QTAALALKTPPSVCGLVLCALLGLALWKAGSGKGLSGILVPLACGGYLLLCLCVIARHAERLPHVFVQIFGDAFTPRAPLGILGTPAMRQGIAKGIFSSEAGCGTAPTAHQSAKGTTPAAQGLFGVFEVFVDTLLLCTATGLSILLTNGGRLSAYRNAEARLCVDTFADLLPRAAAAVVFVFVFLFAFETLLAFFAYSRQVLTAFALPRPLRAAAIFLFFCAVAFGAGAGGHALWTLSDFFLLCMLLCSTSALFCGRYRVTDAFERQIGKDFSSLSEGRKRLCVQDRRAGRVICGSRSRSGYRRWTP
ncbi:MAG: alanine:cation symporter family protein, partial [Clostridia bacterium]|nr:alanine:cation symporter family protein [Clostridia bacterium]